MFYKVKKGDTLAKIAQGKKIPLELLLAFNKSIKNVDNIFIGQLIRIPNIDDVPANNISVNSLKISHLLARARSAVNKGIRYKLGFGGTNPTSPLPTADHLCDCSGFVCWVLGLARNTTLPFYQKFGG
jgi:LysM repeat protein